MGKNKRSKNYEIDPESTSSNTVAEIDNLGTFISGPNDLVKFTGKHKVRAHSHLQSIAVEAPKTNNKKIFIIDLGKLKATCDDYIRLTKVLITWEPVVPKSIATMTIRFRNISYSEEDNQIEMESKGMVRAHWGVAWAMNHFIHMEDIDNIRWEVEYNNLDVKDAILGDLKILYIVSVSQNTYVTHKINPYVFEFTPMNDNAGVAELAHQYWTQVSRRNKGLLNRGKQLGDIDNLDVRPHVIRVDEETGSRAIKPTEDEDEAPERAVAQWTGIY